MAGISAKEESFIATLGGKGIRVFTVDEDAKLFDIDKPMLHKLVYKLVKKTQIAENPER